MCTRKLLSTMASSLLVLGLSASLFVPGAAIAQPTESRIQALEEQVEMLADALEQRSTASSNRTSIGGYGELHYNNYDDQTDMIDFHRFVLFFGHEFSDNIRFFSELELEHSLAGEGKPGEVELEQAYVEFDINENTRAKGGLFLVPVGILNETHEPPTFYGVERNPVESRIIPSTWWEAGAALNGELGEGLAYDVAVHSGLDGGTNIRGGRQKVASATAEDLAFTARLKYTGIAGLELAATLQNQGDMTQTSADNIDGGILFEAHAAYQGEHFGARALYASWDIEGAGAGTADNQEGYYIEGSYRFTEAFGVFARQNVWNLDTALEDNEQTDVGFNYWPHPNVVIKFDVQSQNAAAGDRDGFNVGIGYQFF